MRVAVGKTDRDNPILRDAQSTWLLRRPGAIYAPESLLSADFNSKPQDVVFRYSAPEIRHTSLPGFFGQIHR
jgi:hypothetical protein